MIRVTYTETDGALYEEEYTYMITNNLDRIRLFKKGKNRDIFTIVLKDNLIKIKKQVKDLTLDEINKLSVIPYMDNGKFAGVCSAEIGIEFKLDDYIAITELVKGEL